MKLEQYLQEGEAALTAVEGVFTEAQTLLQNAEAAVEAEAKTLLADAEAAFNALKSSGIAGTATGPAIATFVADLTTAYANAKQLVNNDVSQIIAMVNAGEAQLKLLAAQFAGGNDVTQPTA